MAKMDFFISWHHAKIVHSIMGGQNQESPLKLHYPYFNIMNEWKLFLFCFSSSNQEEKLVEAVFAHVGSVAPDVLENLECKCWKLSWLLHQSII